MGDHVDKRANKKETKTDVQGNVILWYLKVSKVYAENKIRSLIYAIICVKKVF